MPDKGQILALHIPTGDIWSLSPFWEGKLNVVRFIDGQAIPLQWEPQVRALYAETHRRADVLRRSRPVSGIELADSSALWAESHPEETVPVCRAS